MLKWIAQKLYRSVKSGDPLRQDWFEAALETAINRGVGLDQVIWEAVREILYQVEQEAGLSSRERP